MELPLATLPSTPPAQPKNLLSRGVIVLLLAALGYLGYQNWQLKQDLLHFPTNFEQCSALPESVIQESYPATCVTKYGQGFTQITPFPTPSSNPTATWKTYTDENATFKYPNDWVIQERQTFGSRTETEFKYGLTTVLTFQIIGNYNNQTEKSFTSLDEFLLPGPDTQEYGNIELADIMIDGRPAKKEVSPGVAGHVGPYQQAAVFSPDSKSVLSFYYQSEYYDLEANQPTIGSQEVLDQILSTFKFTE